jgi:hypothetical protein
VISRSPSEPIAAPAVQPGLTNVPPAPLPPKQNLQPEFRLNGIIYTRPRPSAILNGKTVFVGDRVGGATVISIGQTEVTLQVNGRRRTYTLP